MILDRRDFLKATMLGMSAYFLPPGARAQGSNNVLVVLFQFGAADGLQIVAPYADPDYYLLRPTIAKLPEELLDLDGFFGFHPAFAPLHPIFQNGDLAVIHAAGSPHASRSHFDCQDWMERGAPGDKTIVDGWINRFLASQGSGEPIEGITINAKKAKGFFGDAPSIAFKSIADFTLSGKYTAERATTLENLFAPGMSALAQGVNEAFSAIQTVSSVDTTTSTVYPGSTLGQQLADAAALIRAEIGIKVIMVPVHKWDHHSNIEGRMDDIGGGFAQSVAAFWEDLGSYQASTCTVGMTEFGRRAFENGGGGTDHGHGGVMWCMGGNVSGGRVLLENDTWPGLKEEQLFKGEDLQVTSDFRDVICEVLDTHVGMSDPGSIFPDFSSSPGNYPGLFT